MATKVETKTEAEVAEAIKKAAFLQEAGMNDHAVAMAEALREVAAAIRYLADAVRTNPAR